MYSRDINTHAMLQCTMLLLCVEVKCQAAYIINEYGVESCEHLIQSAIRSPKQLWDVKLHVASGFEGCELFAIQSIQSNTYGLFSLSLVQAAHDSSLQGQMNIEAPHTGNGMQTEQSRQLSEHEYLGAHVSSACGSRD